MELSYNKLNISLYNKNDRSKAGFRIVSMLERLQISFKHIDSSCSSILRTNRAPYAERYAGTETNEIDIHKCRGEEATIYTF